MAHQDAGQVVDRVPERDREVGGQDLGDRILRSVRGTRTPRDGAELDGGGVSQAVRQRLEERRPSRRAR